MSITNLNIKRGDTAFIQVTATLNGVDYNLTGHTIWFTAKQNENDADSLAVIRKDNIVNGQGGIAINPITPPGITNNTATITINPGDTINLSNNQMLHYDIQIKSPTGAVTTIAEGILRLSNDITRAT